MDLRLTPLCSVDEKSAPYYYVDNVLNDEQIRYIINSAELNKEMFSDAQVGYNSNSVDDRNIRRSKVFWLDPNDTTLTFFYKMLKEKIVAVNQLYFRYNLTGFENTQFTKYIEDDQSFYNWHQDEDPTGFKNEFCRKLSTIIFLTDPSEFEGGELQISTSPNNIINVEQKKGRMVFFPSFTTHKVNPVTKGVRYSAVTWARGPAFC